MPVFFKARCLRCLLPFCSSLEFNKDVLSSSFDCHCFNLYFFNKKVEHLFLYLSTICVFPPASCLFMFFTHFPIRKFILLICKNAFKIYLFIYLFFAVLGLRFCARAFSSCGKRGPLFTAVRGPLTVTASLVAEHRLQTRRLSSCGSRT